MADNDRIDEGQHEEGLLEKTVSRRQFLKVAGVAGAAIGLSGGLGGLLAACGDGETTATTGTGGAGTDVSAGAEEGDRIKVGFVAPLTGPLASFGVPDKYCVDRWNEAVADGVVCGDNKNHKFDIKISDSQSDSNRAAQVAGDLINNDGVDMIVVASTPDTVAPVADQCEALETPCFSDDCPWQPYVGTRSSGDLSATFKWTYHFFWGLEDMVINYQDIWSQMDTNKVVGALWPNDADGNAYRKEFTPALEASGYKLIDPGAYQNFSEDFTEQINAFKAAGCEIITGVPQPPDATNFVKQAAQQGLTPKICTLAKALLFPQSVEALGDIGDNLTTEIWWSPRHPFKSSLDGSTCQQLADDYEAKTKGQWTQPLLHYAVFEIAVAAAKLATDPKDKTSIIETVPKLKVETIAGLVDFTAPVKEGTMRPHQNVYKSPQVAGQWQKQAAGAKYPFELMITTNKLAPEIKVDGTTRPLK
ncbi:MAG: ABC transporter substrate-binding protein [Thermoleophilia bacterium]|jgi:branched-chain amino acid transport system substrate-binding protein